MGATLSVRLAHLTREAQLVRERIDGMIAEPDTATLEEFHDTLGELQRLSDEIHREEIEMRRKGVIIP